MRFCKDCKIEKPLEKFVKDKRAKEGRTNQCNECKNAENRVWVAANPEKNRLIKRASQKKHYTTEKRRREYLTPGYYEKQRERQRKSRIANPIPYMLRCRERKRHVKLRTPKWLTKQDKQYMRDLYIVAKIFSDNSVENYHVDHIIPLRGKYVNGLHVPSNLQIIEAITNIRKQAQFSPITI